MSSPLRRRIAATLIVSSALAVACHRSPTAPPPSGTSSATNADEPISSQHAKAQQSLQRAVGYLLAKQSDDGGWHSERYGLLRSGQALTPFILHALLQAESSHVAVPASKTDAAFAFIRRHVNADGAIGFAHEHVVEYPNYSTAYALVCLVQRNDARDRPLVERMRDYLLRQQYEPSRGFTEESLEFGGWGFGDPREPGDPGHMDLAHTRRVLESLAAAGVSDKAAFARSQSLLRLLQRHPDERRPQPKTDPAAKTTDVAAPYDGGFYFSPIVLAANKGRAGEDGMYFRSYATATCDGLLALLASGVPADDPRVTDALKWLDKHPAWNSPAGIPADHPEPWADALHFYHLAVRSEAYARLRIQQAWQSELFSVLLPQQNDDGGFVNAKSPLMKEDDPLLCTALSVIAVTHALK